MFYCVQNVEKNVWKKFVDDEKKFLWKKFSGHFSWNFSGQKYRRFFRKFVPLKHVLLGSKCREKRVEEVCWWRKKISSEKIFGPFLLKFQWTEISMIFQKICSRKTCFIGFKISRKTCGRSLLMTKKIPLENYKLKMEIFIKIAKWPKMKKIRKNFISGICSIMFKMSRKTCGKSLLVTKKNFLWKKFFRNIWWELFFHFQKFFTENFIHIFEKLLLIHNLWIYIYD